MADFGGEFRGLMFPWALVLDFGGDFDGGLWRWTSGPRLLVVYFGGGRYVRIVGGL